MHYYHWGSWWPGGQGVAPAGAFESQLLVGSIPSHTGPWGPLVGEWVKCTLRALGCSYVTLNPRPLFIQVQLQARYS